MAVSPVIANVIMAGAVIAVGTVVLVWALSNFDSRQAEAGALFSTESGELKESFMIEDVWFYEDSDRHVDVTIRNVGMIDLQVVTIHVCVCGEGSDYETVWEEGEGIQKGEAETITVSFPWISGEYFIRVTTARGNQVTQSHNTSN
jgi:archaellum component FlaF (FlaF/FlaG flagellin family)